MLEEDSPLINQKDANMMPTEMYLKSNRVQREFLRSAIFRKMHAGMLVGASPAEFFKIALEEQIKTDDNMGPGYEDRLVQRQDIHHVIAGLEDGTDLYVCMERLNLFTSLDLSVMQNVLHFDSYLSEKRLPGALEALGGYYKWKENQDFSQPLLADFIYRLWLLERFGTAYPSLAIRGDDYLQDWSVGRGVESPSLTLSANLSGLNVPEFARRVILQGEKTDDLECALKVLVDYYCK